MNPKELRETITVIVEELLDEAVRRDAYIEGLVNSAKGALGEYFKARYAEVNTSQRRGGFAGTREGWDREVENLLGYNFFQAASKDLKGGEAQRAFEQAILSLRKLVPTYLRLAKKHVAESFAIPLDAMLDPSDSSTDEFFAMLVNMFDDARRA
jgi:hypothetical protein